MWEALLLAVSSNLDDLGVGLSLGIRGEAMTAGSRATIALISGATMGLGLALGERVLRYVPYGVEKALPAMIFGSLGGWFLWKAQREGGVREPLARRGWLASLILGIALGIDSILLGFSGGIAGYPWLWTVGLATLTSWSFLTLGSALGGRVKLQVGETSDYLAGGLLLVLAFVEWFG